MRVFGYSIPLIFVLLFAFVMGAKNPAIVARIPLINKL